MNRRQSSWRRPTQFFQSTVDRRTSRAGMLKYNAHGTKGTLHAKLASACWVFFPFCGRALVFVLTPSRIWLILFAELA